MPNFTGDMIGIVFFLLKENHFIKDLLDKKFVRDFPHSFLCNVTLMFLDNVTDEHLLNISVKGKTSENILNFISEQGRESQRETNICVSFCS